MEEFKNMIHQIGVLYQKLTKRQRIVISASIVIVIAFLVFLALYRSGGSTGYAVLVENANPTDSAAIVARLEQDGVSYLLENERTILVPQDQVARQRMMIASEGLIKDRRTGFELFDTQQFGATAKEMDVKFQRAIEGELARTISTLEPIQSATVHIAFPKDTVFTERQVPPTASVAVNIKSGSKLTRKQIDGIKNLVSAAVPKLANENVRIVDQKGVPLDNQDMYENEIFAELEKFRKARIEELEEKVKGVLKPLNIGKNEVRCAVDVDINSTKMESLIEYFDPNTVIRSSQTLHEESQGRPDPTIQGVPGAVSNIGPVEGLDGRAGLEYSEKDQETINNEVSKTTTTIKKTFDTIGRLSASVYIPRKMSEITSPDGQSRFEFTSRSPQELATIENLVRNTINFDARRGDSVTVAEYDPEPQMVDAGQSVYEKYIDPFMGYVKYIIAAILLFVFYKKVIAPFIQKMLADIEDTEEEYKLETGPVEEDEDALAKFANARKRVEDSLGLGDSIDEDALQYDVLIEKLRAIINEKTEEVAALLQTLVENDSAIETKDM